MGSLLKLMIVLILIFCPNWCIIVRCENPRTAENTTSPEVICGKLPEMLAQCFNSLSPSMLEILSTVHVAETIEEIHARCVVFNHGMDCVNKYVRECIDSKQIVENSVYGAKKLFEYLCKEKYFQQGEFLRHSDCFYHVQKDWDICSNQFNDILQEELAKAGAYYNPNTKYLNYCCARHAFENCVYTSAKLKCRMDSAIFIRKLSKLLSTEKQFSNCDKVEEQLCSIASAITLNFLLIFFFILFRFY